MEMDEISLFVRRKLLFLDSIFISFHLIASARRENAEANT